MHADLDADFEALVARIDATDCASRFAALGSVCRKTLARNGSVLRLLYAKIGLREVGRREEKVGKQGTGVRERNRGQEKR